MSTGYAAKTIKRSFEKEGVTGEVTRLLEVIIEYPYLLLIDSKEKAIEKYKLQVLAGLIKSAENQENKVSLYLNKSGKTISLGKIGGRQVKGFLRLFESNEIIGKFDENTDLIGNYLYVLTV
ncbi:MAG: hypothetical protein LBM93_06065 [Oscillospiraceae bacterium]|jgi:hypothetical protein|nr:hypothetical protein [Oscillospiraceae bacterium]